MPLNQSLLTKAKQHGDKTIAQCPACAEAGGDRNGVHLVVYPDGRFGCVAHPKDKGHRRRIAELAGDDYATARQWHLNLNGRIVLSGTQLKAKPTAQAIPIHSLSVETLRKAKATSNKASEPSEVTTSISNSDAPDASFSHTRTENKCPAQNHEVSAASILYAIYGKQASEASEEIIHHAITAFDGKVARFAPGEPIPPSKSEVLRGWKHCPTSARLSNAKPKLLGWKQNGAPIYARS